ncbi:MAG: Dihydroorotate dehydrogenase [Candidatus Magnetoglobus multicellularis str. Araruama]|uniref:Dihydroorotate dehydrogenase n=1 Tax=Candidatus Magnetoglobus multicellularis str. Araruama TaxID=890399 RepID=A0A1V1PHZ3_9BACT|nr:MAG: Dihydroorotate dehydrogenase [Candidatus Magnetoglobus multicellularis str. Araruama]
MYKIQPNLAVTIANGLTLKNPVMTASGTFGYGQEFSPFVDLNQLGAIIVKGLSLEPSPGNPPPRIVETPCGMLNAIGLENVGFQAFVQTKIPFLNQFDTPIIVNIYGKTIDEYALLAEKMDEIPTIAALEINISCPNVKAGGVAFGTDPKLAFSVIASVRQKTTKPLIVKLTPNVTDIVCIAKTVADAGADAISLINTLTGMAVDIHTKKPILRNIVGGLSGPAIKPVALRMVWQVAKFVAIPVIGIGGIMNAQDALEFLIVGAQAIQVGTANFVNTHATMDIITGIREYLVENNIHDIKELIGSLNE